MDIRPESPVDGVAESWIRHSAYFGQGDKTRTAAGCPEAWVAWEAWAA